MHRNLPTLTREYPLATLGALGTWLYVWFGSIYVLTDLIRWDAPAMYPHEYVVFGGNIGIDLLVFHGTYLLLGILALVAFNEYAHYFFEYVEEKLGMDEESLAATFAWN